MVVHYPTTLLDYTDRFPSLYGRMWMAFALEECYVAIVLVNLMDKEDIVPWNHALSVGNMKMAIAPPIWDVNIFATYWKTSTFLPVKSNCHVVRCY